MNTKTIIGFAVTALVILAFLVGVIFFGPKSSPVNNLEGVEVTEYQGENLSSVNHFRENSIKGPQHVDINTYHLEVNGLVTNSTNYSYDKVIDAYQHYRKVVKLNCVEGWSVNILWDGFLVKDLLAKAQPKAEAKVIIFHAYDGYTTSFPIEYVMNNNIMMAYMMNGINVPPERGYPFVLVAESKWGYKWIKWITRIELSDNVDYRGYWESAGYSNEGDLGKSFFDFEG